jgi:phosphatidyl-myo-inositol dimannoside synthase
MTITALISELGQFGGIQRYNRELLAVLGDAAANWGIRVRVLNLNDGAQEQMAKRSVEVRCFSGDRYRFASAAIRAMRSSSIVILGHCNVLPLWYLAYGLGARSKTIQVLHGLEAWCRLPFVHRSAARHLNIIASVSRYTAGLFAELNHINPSRVTFHVIPNGVDIRRADDRSGPESSQEGPVLLSVARLTSWEREGKGILHTIYALQTVVERFPTIKYRIVGGGDDESYLKTVTRGLGLEHNVEFLGKITDHELDNCYRNANLFVLPSNQEGFGIVYIEAMIFGLPVVAADSAATPEVVVDGQTGRLVRWGDPSAIARAIVELLEQGDLAQRMGIAGRQRVRQHYTTTQFRQHWLSLLAGDVEVNRAYINPCACA